MFTLTISICCFWNNLAAGGPGEKQGGRIAVSRAQLGFRDWEAGPDYVQNVEGRREGELVFFSSRPSQGS